MRDWRSGAKAGAAMVRRCAGAALRLASVASLLCFANGAGAGSASARPLPPGVGPLQPEFDRAWDRGLGILPLPDPDGYSPDRIWLAHCYGTLAVGRDTMAERVPIRSLRFGDELAPAERLPLEVLRTDMRHSPG